MLPRRVLRAVALAGSTRERMVTTMRTCVFSASIAGLAIVGIPTDRAEAAIATKFFGDIDLVGYGYGTADPTAGATLVGLQPGAADHASTSFGHGFPFSPEGDDFPGTDQIFVGSHQTASHDGYSQYSARRAGPQTLLLDYGSLVPNGHGIDSLTLGIAADDFQRPSFGQPFSASINGAAHAELTDVLNGLNQTGPSTQFFTIGLSPSLLLPGHTLTLAIDQGGDGGDGWAVDFLTIGVESSPVVPEPAVVVIWSLLAVSMIAIGCWRRRQA